MDRCKYQHDLTLIPTRKDGSGARGHWLAGYSRESSVRVGVIAGGVMASAMLLGLSIVPTAHADDILATIEADALSYLPLNIQELALNALGDSIPSSLGSDLEDTYSNFLNVDQEALIAALSNAEFAPEITDALGGLADVEGAISDVSSVASVGLSIGELSVAAIAAGAG
jgi:hypothetical protein